MRRDSDSISGLVSVGVGAFRGTFAALGGVGAVLIWSGEEMLGFGVAMGVVEARGLTALMGRGKNGGSSVRSGVVPTLKIVSSRFADLDLLYCSVRLVQAEVVSNHKKTLCSGTLTVNLFLIHRICVGDNNPPARLGPVHYVLRCSPDFTANFRDAPHRGRVAKAETIGHGSLQSAGVI